jgi:cystathionine beta-synthase
MPGSIIPDQYKNIYNVMAHYDGTAEEILAAFPDAEFDTVQMIVAGAGTGGTVTGIGMKMRELAPHIKIHTGQLSC